MWSWIRVFSLAFDVTEMRKEEPSNFFSFGIVSRQEKMSAFVGKQVVLLVHTKLFLTATKKKKKSFLFGLPCLHSFFQYYSIYNIHEFWWPISILHKSIQSYFCTARQQSKGPTMSASWESFTIKKISYRAANFFFDYYCNLAQQLNLFLH